MFEPLHGGELVEVATLQKALEAALSERYALERELGRGGMATVYLARDLRHRRPVAIKVLHPELSAVLGPERFLQEIELTASLQHPHILPLFDSGSAEGLLYYVMPYVDGEALRARLERERQLPVGEAVRLAREVAGALAYAHARGVVHRDMKPENVLLQGDHALVADFGIALAVQHAGGARMTQTGLSLGTPQYMAPEQAMGERAVDHRVDVYALGAVLYEMLAGEPPFTGPTAQAVVARVMTESPRSLALQRPSVPPHVDAAVRTALEKLAADRFPSVEEFAAALLQPTAPHGIPPSHSAADGATSGARVSRHQPFVLGPRAAAALGVGALAVGAVLGLALRSAPDGPAFEREPVRFTIEPDSGTLAQTTPAISADGRTIVYARMGTNGTLLYSRRVDQIEALPLAGTEDAEWPFFSPDGEWVAFYSGGAIRKVRLDGGRPVLVTSVPSPTVFCGGAWGPNDTILYITGTGELHRVSAAGGTASRVALADSSLRVWAARALPGGRAVLVNIAEGSDPGRIGVLDLESGRVSEFGPALGAHYVPGYLVYAGEGGELYRRPFDLDRLEPTGVAEQIASDVAYAEGRLGRVGLGLAGFFPSFDASPTGALVYRVGAIPNPVSRRLTLVDRAGREQRIIAARAPWTPRFSPDGRRVAYGAFAPGRGLDESDVWISEIGAGTTQRVTTDGRDSNDPVWSPDGQSVAYSSLDTGSRKDLRVQPIDGGGARRVTVRPRTVSPPTEWPSDWSPDGRALIFTQVTAAGEMDLWIQPTAGDTASPFLATPAREFGARLSPDGRWVAYTSNETGRYEVYVQPYPTLGRKTPVSVGGGANPVWRGDGRELFYWQWQAGQLFAASVEGGGPGEALKVRTRTRLFSAPYIENFHANYDVSPDGTRFVLVTGQAVANHLVVELNVLDGARANRGGR